MTTLFKSIRLGNLTLKSPIVCASGTAGFLKELKGLVDFGPLGAGITKTVTLEPRSGNRGVRIAEVDCGILNAIGLENPGIDAFLKEVYPRIKKLPVRVIVSVAAKSPDEFSVVAKKLAKEPSIRAVELNLSCPNVKGKIIAQHPQEAAMAIKALRRSFSGTVIAKLSPDVTDIASVAVQAQDAGADALSLVNTFVGIAFDVTTQKPLLGNVTGGYSGKGIKPIALCKVWKAAQVVSIPIIGGGGICDWKDAAEFFIAGATAVSVGTATFVSPKSIQEIYHGLYRHMRKHKIKKMGKLEIRVP